MTEFSGAAEFAVRAAGGSVVGRRYADNFDVVHLREEPLLAVVADGMGDGEGSRAAGRIGVAVFVEHLPAAEDAVDAATLRAAVARAQAEVGAAGRRIGGLTGCTLTALVAAGAGPVDRPARRLARLPAAGRAAGAC